MSATLLTMGGITALVVGVWGHIRQAFQYLSSFLIITAPIQGYILKAAIIAHLKANYKLLPSGMFTIDGLLLPLRNHSSVQGFVPFRLLNPVNIFWRGKTVILVRVSDSTGLKLSALRGTLDVERLTVEALDTYESQLTSNTNSRFYVRRVQGSEKFGMGSFDMKSKRGSSLGEEAASDAPTGSSSGLINLQTDTSFRFPRDAYVFQRESDAFENIYLPDHAKEHIRMAKLWFDNGDWYKQRGIPWRKGWLVHGPGGTGKSSLARAVAQQFGIPLYQFQLNTLSDQEITREWDNVSWPAIALFEDFDTVFHGRESQTEHRALTFDCILNLLSGVDSKSGVFVIVTTNNLHHIDPAMGTKSQFEGQSTRPGRLDVVFELGFMERKQREMLARRVLIDWPELIGPAVDDGEGMTGAQFEDFCTNRALHQISNHGLPLSIHKDVGRNDGTSDKKESLH